jgi:hypothetical protein
MAVGGKSLRACAALLVVIAAGCGTARSGEAVPLKGHLANVTESIRGSGAERGEALAYARRLLGELRLPPSTRPMARPGRNVGLLKPMLPVQLDDVVDIQVQYRTGAPMSSVRQFLARHVPAGMRPGDAGQAGHFNRALAEYVSYLPTTLPHGLSGAVVATAVTPAGHGRSILRAVAQVTWYPQRTAAEYIHAAGYRSVSVTVPPGSHGPAQMVTRTFTSPRVLAKLAALINSLPAQAPVDMTCPALSVQRYSIIFVPRAGRWPRIHVWPTGCFTDAIWAGGRAQPTLDELHGAVIATMRKLLGLPVR